MALVNFVLLSEFISELRLQSLAIVFCIRVYSFLWYKVSNKLKDSLHCSFP